MNSPRGRIALMKGITTGEVSLLSQEFADNMYMCLGCRACESACPAGVKYGRLVEAARDVIEEIKQETGHLATARVKMSRKERMIRQTVFKKLFLYPNRVDNIGKLLWLAQALGLQTLADRTRLITILPKPMAQMQKAVPKVASPFRRNQRKQVVPSQDTKTKYRIGLFKGCIMDVLFFETNEKTASVLAKVGCDVVFVENQACCGALHAHSGESYGAIDLAKRNIAAFEEANVDYIINNAGGCGAALKEYAHWLKDDPEWADRAQEFVYKVKDVTEFLAGLPSLPFINTLSSQVTYQDSCHLRHGQGIFKQPRDLLRQIPGIAYVELPQADECCGSAGIYNITNFELSMKILDGKMEHVKKTKANVIVTSNPGCLVQMRQGIIRAGLQDHVEAVHIIDLLDRVM